MTKKKRKQRELLDYKVNALHELEHRLDKVIAEYNFNVFRRQDLIIQLAQTDDDTIDYDEIKRHIRALDARIYTCQEKIRDLTIELAEKRQEVYNHWINNFLNDKGDGSPFYHAIQKATQVAFIYSNL